MGYLLLSFYSSNSVKMLISPIRGGRVCVCVCTKWYHTQLNVCMGAREPADCIAVQVCMSHPGLWSH